MTEQSKTPKVKVSAGISVGGASTAIIAAYNAWGDPTNAAFITTAVPILVGALFWFTDYAFSAIGLRPLEELKVVRSFENDIKDLEKRIKKAKKLDYPQETIDILVKQHIKLVLARSEISSNFTKTQTQ